MPDANTERLLTCFGCGVRFKPNEPIYQPRNALGNFHRYCQPMTSIPLTSITEGTRIRNKKNYGDLSGLIESLSTVGSIHPIVLARDGQTFTLVAGGRRFAAMTKMGVKELWHGSVLNPEKLGFVYEEEVSEARRREAEIDENLYRLDVSWIDNTLAIADAHELHKAKNLKWGFRQTAALFHDRAGFSTANVKYAVTVAKHLRSGDKDFLACESFSDAISLHMKKNEDLALAELTRRNAAKTAASPIVKIDLGGTGSFLDEIRTSLGPKIDFAATSVITTPGALGKTEALAKAKEIVATVEPVTVPLSSMLLHGDSLRVHMPSFPDASFDHIVTDIPYGIDMDNLTGNVADVAAQHDVELNVSQMPLFLEQSFRLVKPRGFCVFFFDLDHWNLLQTEAKRIGWKVQDWPLIWVKTHNCQNQGPQYNYTKTYECAMVLRKDSETVLRKPRPNAVWSGDGSAERKLYNNKFAKPFLLWKELIFDNIAFPGQTIYDPFGGEFSSCRAAVNCGLIPYASEIEEHHFVRGVENMKSVYALLHSSNVKFV